MSHPFYNPYVPGNQGSTQGSYGLPGVQAERNPRTGSPHFGPGSGSSAASSAPPGGMTPSLLTQTVSYRPEQGRAKFDTDIERSVDLHISRARDEVTFVGKPDHRPMGQSNRFTNTQEILSSGTGTTSYLMSTASASAGRRHSDVERGGGSSDWLPCYTRSSAEDSSTFSSAPASTNYTGSERQREAPPTQGLGDFDYRVSDQPGATAETSRPKYNTEAATDILLQFGLEKKDLDYLIAYPEEQMTPDNLPFILRQIRTHKTERAERTAIQPKPYPQPQPIRGVSGLDGFHGSGGSPAVLQPTKVIDYGHTGNYAGGEIGRPSGVSGNMLLVNTNNISSHTQEPPRKDPAEVKSSSLGSSFGQGGAVSDSSYISILSTDPAQRLKTQPNQTYQAILSSSYLSRKNKEGGFRHEESSKARPLKKTQADHKSAANTQPSSGLFRSVHPDRPDLVVIGTSGATGTKNPSATQGKGSMVAKQTFKQQQPTPTPKKQVPKQPVTHMGKALWPPAVSATPPASLVAIHAYPPPTVPPPGFSPHSTSTPSASLQPARSPKNFLQSPTQHPAELPDTNPLPTPAMMHDYAAATPGVFPHTCSLCFKEFTNMKDWISHQNTSLHLESCRVLRTKYPHWNGQILLEPSAARKDAKPSSSAPAQTSHQRRTNTSHGGRSRSHSEGRREKRSRSLSSHSSRYTRSRSRSRSPRYDHDWSCSRSHERPRRRDDGWSSPTRSLERRSPMPRRSEERWSSPRRSRERLSPPGRRGDRWPSPGWSEERWPSPGRSRERLSSPRRGDERWLSPKRRDDLWYSRRPSSPEGSPQRRLSGASRPSKKQTGKSDVQSLPTLIKTLTKAKAGKRLNLAPSAVRKSPGSAASLSAKKKTMATTSLQKSDVSAPPKPKVFKPAPPTMVRLEGVVNGLSHSDVVAAAEQFGKTKSVVLFRKKLEALVCFENEEDAKKLKSLKSIDLRGIPVSVVTQKILPPKKTLVKKPVLPGVSTSQTTKTTKNTTSSRTVLLQTPCKASQNPSGAKTKQIEQAPASASQAAGSDSAVSQELLTVGDTIVKHLNQNKIKCISKKSCQLKQFLESDKRHMVISQLPKYEDGCYTEEDIANVFLPYGFIYKRENIFVFPEACMAFVVMQTVRDAHEIMKLMVWNSIMFKGTRLLPHVIIDNVLKSPLMFYSYLMSLFLTRPEEDRGERIIYIEGISPSEARDLREVLRKIGSVTNYLPLLNKAFVEFDSSRDADRLGVWHSLLNHAPGYKVYRLKPTDDHSEAPLPRLPANALPDSKDVVPGATILTVKFGVPPGSIGPFWVAMATSPFVFPSVSPWFIIPEHLTVKGEVDIETASSRGTMFPTLMLTGLPEGGYSQEDVAKLVWPYFPKHTLHSLYYNVIVLTLQRRAFVHFSDWTSCCDFVRDHIRKPVVVRGCVLKIHFVLEDMYPESKEELMYKSMMKWSNSRVPDAQSLEERLLCVEISPTSVNIVKSVMYTVASIAKLVGFLPLANRICVEMADSSGVTEVLEKCNLLTSVFASQAQKGRVQAVESVKTLKQRLEDCSESTLNLGIVRAEAPPPTQPPLPQPSANGQQPVEQTSFSASAKPAACDESVPCEHGEKLGTESVLDSTACPQSNEEKVVKMAEEGSPATTHDAASGTTHTHLVDPEEPTTQLLQIDQEPLAAKEGQEDFSDDALASDANIFDEPNFDMSDFVTLDEISDVEEISPDPHSSLSSKQSSTGTKLKQSSGTSHAPKNTSNRSSNRSSTRSSTRSSKDSKSSASFSSKSPKDYVRRSSSSSSTSVLPKATKDSSKPTKSPASSSASSSFVTLETSPSSGHKAQRSKTKSPLRGSHASSSSRGIRPSQTARERAKMLSASVSVERLPVSQRRAASERVVADLKDTKLKDLEASKEKKREDHDKGTKAEDVDGENDQTLESLDGLTDNQKDEGTQAGSSDTKTPEPEKCLVLDSVNDDGKACPEKSTEKEVDSVTKNKTAKEESDLVEDDASTVKQEANNEVCVRVLDPGRKEEEEGESTSAESCKDVKRPDDRIPEDEDQPPKVCDNKDSDVTEQETFEILDSIDDQTIMEQNTEAQSDQTSTDISPREEEEDASKVVDSVADQTTTTESESDNKKPDAASRRDDRYSKRSGLRTRASKSEEKVKSPEKQDRVVKRSETPQDSSARLPQRDQDPEEEKVSEMLHSTEELVQVAAATERTDRRRSGRGKKEEKMTLTEASEKPDEAEEASYEILDSVEDETATEEPVVMTRSTRGRRGRTMTQKDQTKKEDTPTRGRRTPAKESQEKTLEMEKEASSKENSPTKKSDITVREEIDEDATYEILDSVEDEVLQDDRPPTGGKRKRGRPKRAVKSTRKKTVTLKGDKDASEKEAGDDEEEPLYQIVDSVEDDQVQEESMTTEESKDETCPKEEEAAVQEDDPTCRTVVEASDKVVTKDLDHEGSSKTKVQDPTTPEVERNQVTSSLVDLDEVSDEEEDYPDDIAEEEELRERMAAAKEKQLAAEEERKEQVREREEEVEVDTMELLTLDEVEADEAGEEVAQMRPESNGEVPAADLQGLVTPEKAVEEVEEKVEARPPIKDVQSVDSATQTSDTLDEASDDVKEKLDQVEPTPRPATAVSKRKMEIVGPEAKKSRSQSPSLPVDFNLPPFRANQPLGQEFVVPKSGYFCNICRVFYLKESSAKDVHCSSQAHYNNLQKHLHKLRQKLSTSSTPNSQACVSD